MGFEPTTSTLARSHSTTELLPLVASFYSTYVFTANHCSVLLPMLCSQTSYTGFIVASGAKPLLDGIVRLIH
jgi:hypothetical protein